MTKVIVKAANGSVEDFRVEAEKDWTIYQLKNHIYRHYPSHPPITVQKLIYGGKLLLDQMSLGEVLPMMGGDGNSSASPNADDSFVIHLVAYQRSNSAPTAPMVETSQKRDHTQAPPPPPPPHVGEEEGGTSAPPAERGEGEARPQPQLNQHNMSPFSNPWLRHRGVGVANPHAGVANPPGLRNFPMFGPGVGPMGGYPFAPPPQFFQSPYGAAYLQQWYNNYYRVPGTRENANPPDLPPRPDEPPNNNLPEPPEDQFAGAVNAPGGMGLMAGAQGMRHRDLVDYIYMLMMVGFLVLVAFLTGSLGRLIIFAAGVMFMLLNQGGFFSLQRRRTPAPPPPVPVVDNPGEAAQRPADQDAPHEGPGAAPQGEVGRDNQEDPAQEQDDVDSPPAPAPAPPPQDRPGLMATLFVFMTSFFTSLVPQQRPDLQVN